MQKMLLVICENNATFVQSKNALQENATKKWIQRTTQDDDQTLSYALCINFEFV